MGGPFQAAGSARGAPGRGDGLGEGRGAAAGFAAGRVGRAGTMVGRGVDRISTGMVKLKRSCSSAARMPSKMPSGRAAAMIMPRRGALGCSGRLAEEMMRLSGVATLSWSSVARMRPTKA